jgi:hypothetical protein
VAVCSVEYGAILLIGLAGWCGIEFLGSRHRSSWMRKRCRDLLIFILVLVALWPSSLLQLNLFRSYLFIGFVQLFRREQMASMNSLGEALLRKWNANPAEILLLLGILVLVGLKYRRQAANGPVAVCLFVSAVIMILQFNRLSGLGWYLFPIFAAGFSFLLPWVVDDPASSRKWLRSPMLPISVAVLLLIFSFDLAPSDAGNRRADLKACIDRAPADTVVAPLTVYTWLQPYYPGRVFLRYHDSESTGPGFDERVLEWTKSGTVITSPGFRDSVDAVLVGAFDGYRVFTASSGGHQGQ